MNVQQAFAARGTYPVDLFITEELGSRAGSTPVDYAREAEALKVIAARQADDPETVLPGLVELAMELTGATSAGLSLLEPDPAPGIFRWRHLTGLLACFDNATTPRNYSPCGVTLDNNDVVLTRHPERYYDWIADAGLVVPEVLLVPLHVGRDVPAGTLWVVGERSGQFHAEHARLLGELASFVGLILKSQLKEQSLRQALDEKDLIASEMHHRLKNIFTMTESMIRISARNAETPDSLAESLSGRIHALADANALVYRALSGAASRELCDLKDVLAAVTRAHDAVDENRHRFVLDGPPVACGNHAISGLALLFHELATNAVKYGSLAREDGKVTISWQRRGDTIMLQWVERGGFPITAPPGSKGFGSTLIRRTVESQFGGTLRSAWPEHGLEIELELSGEKLAI